MVSVRIQSEAAVRQFGVLGFFYNSASEEVRIDYVRVRKSDGTVIETPPSSVQDVSSEVAVVAPTYSDLRQKQIPVKALGVGDVLEYSVQNLQQKPEIRDQFWYTQNFTDSGVILKQTLEVRLPRDKYVQVSSPKLKAEIRDEAGQRVYLWTHSHLEPTQPDAKQKSDVDNDTPKVQLTTFKNWEEVGNWWAGLAATRAAVTPSIEQKAKELTAGLSSDAEKERAIYRFVAMRFRYISVSLGVGRYRPHSAAEVLENAYGDCKDKHTLFAALLQAAGIQAWPALIGAGIKFDESLPSPAQFNHVITVIPDNGKYIWLDTTGEVAPFGWLSQEIRDEKALLIPVGSGVAGEKPMLTKTPVDPPAAVSETLKVKASLSSEGTLTGHFDFELADDGALALRTGFRQLAPSQWQAFLQQVSYSLSYAGDVSAVAVDNLENTDQPLHLGYDYTRKNFSDWEEHKITPPLPPLGFGPGDSAEKPKEPFWTGAPGRLTYRAAIALPKGFSVQLPGDKMLASSFATYTAHYAVDHGTLVAERTMTIKKSKIGGNDWAEYQKFSKELREEQAQFLSLVETGKMRAETASGSRTQELIDRAGMAWQAQNMNEMRSLLAQAERLNPREARLWALYGLLEVRSGHLDQAIVDCRKEIQLHADEPFAYAELSFLLDRAGRKDEAVDALRSGLALNPEDARLAASMAHLLVRAKRYREIPPVLEKAIAAAPENYSLQTIRAEAWLRSGQTEQGTTAAQKLAASPLRSTERNDLAYLLAETDSDLGLAQELAQTAVDQIEQDCAKGGLDKPQNQDFAAVQMLAAAWDTLGWVYFHRNDMAAAERYLTASWRLSEQADVADHLGQIKDKQGKHAEAIHMWRLALASDNKNEDARKRLRQAGVHVPEAAEAHSGPEKRAETQAWIANAQELGELRTIKVPALTKQEGSAEYTVLLSPRGIEDAQYLSGNEGFDDAAAALKEAKYDLAFPDAGPEKIVRQGILSCSKYTRPNCNFTLLLPSMSQEKPVSGVESAEADSQLSSDIASAAQ